MNQAVSLVCVITRETQRSQGVAHDVAYTEAVLGLDWPPSVFSIKSCLR